MIHLDTSLLVGAVSGLRETGEALRRLFAQGEPVACSTLVLYEWLRGPRLPDELEEQAALFPPHELVPFGIVEAETAARLYRALRRARQRDVDIAIAACAIVHNATLWTLNPQDFSDIPGLKLYAPPRRR